MEFEGIVGFFFMPDIEYHKWTDSLLFDCPIKD